MICSLYFSVFREGKNKIAFLRRNILKNNRESMMHFTHGIVNYYQYCHTVLVTFKFSSPLKLVPYIGRINLTIIVSSEKRFISLVARRTKERGTARSLRMGYCPGGRYFPRVVTFGGLLYLRDLL